MIELPDRDMTDAEGEEWYECIMCGTSYKHAELHFDSGSVAPTVGETFTGATSSDTGVVVSTALYSGSYTGGNAEGTVTLSTLTGVSKDSTTLVETVYQDDETITGSTGGADMMTVKGTPQINKYGRFYSESDIVKFRGKQYCSTHFRFRWGHKLIDEIPFTINEEFRGSEW